MSTPLLKLGSYTFPLGFKVVQVERGRSIGASKLARTDGNRQQRGLRNGVRVTVEGGIYKGPLDTSSVRDRQDALREALAAGPAKLWLYSDRFYRCMEVENEPDSYIATGFNRIDDITISFVGPDPGLYEPTTNTDTWTAPAGSPATRTITYAGNMIGQPEMTFVVGGAGAQSINWTVTNTSTGDSFTLIGSVTGGDSIVLNSIKKTVLIGTTDYRSLFNLLFLTLAEGPNALTITQTTGTISSVTTTWQERWE